MAAPSNRRKSSLPTIPLYVSWPIFLVAVVTPIFLVILIPILMYRWILIWSVKYLRPDLSHILRGMGAAFILDSVDQGNNNVLIQFHLDGAHDLDQLKRRVTERLLRHRTRDGQRLAYPELQQYCVKWGGYFFWKQEKNFNIADHIQMHELKSKQVFNSFLVDYLKQPLPPLKSHWQVLVVIRSCEDRAGTPSYHIVFKFHHSLADGQSMLGLFERLVGKDKPIEWVKYLGKTKISLVDWLTLPVQIARGLSVKTGTIQSWTLPPPEPMRSNMRQQHISLGGDQFIQMKIIRQIAKYHDVCTSAVIYAAIAGALRSHLLNKGNTEQQLPSYIRFPQPVPPLKHPDGLCNSISCVTYQLPIGEHDPVARLHGCDQMIRSSKNTMQRLISISAFKIRSLLPYTFPFLNRIESAFTYLATSNVAACLDAASFNGNTVLAIDSQIMAGPTALYVCMLSYNGIMRWTCNGDTRVLSKHDVTDIAMKIGQEFRILEARSLKLDKSTY